MGVPAEDPLFGLPHHLLYSRHKGVQLFSQSLQGCLLHHVRRSFHPLDNLTGESFGLPNHASHRGQELLISLLQTIPVRSALGAHHASNFQNAKLLLVNRNGYARLGVPVADCEDHRLGTAGQPLRNAHIGLKDAANVVSRRARVDHVRVLPSDRRRH